MNILVLSPHTDDAEIGCGGSLTKWKEQGKEIKVIVFSKCEESIPKEFDWDSTEKEFIKNMELLGIDYLVKSFRVRHFPMYRQQILDEMRKETPDLVVCPSLNDIHQDHKVIVEEAIRAFRCSIISYDLPYSTIGFNGNMYEKLEEIHIKTKQIMLSNYKSQIKKFSKYFSWEYVHANAMVNGLKIKTNYAEVFEVIRWIK